MLTFAGRVALAERAPGEAAARLRRGGAIARRLGAAPLAAEIDGLMPRGAPGRRRLS
jgi:hypothetical protein